MQYRTRLYLSFSSIALISSLLSLFIVYFETKHYLTLELQSKITSIATTAAASLDPELIEQIRTPQDEHSEAYRQIKQDLKKIRDRNRRSDTYVQFLYTLMPKNGQPEIIVYGVDAEEDPKMVSHVGDPTTKTLSKIIVKNKALSFSPKKNIQDPWGNWMSGFAPIFDKDGNYIATLGADISFKFIEKQIHHLIILEIPAFLASILLGLLFASVLSKTITHSLNITCAAVEEIGKGKLETNIQLNTKDEFQKLAETLNQMTKGLRERETLKNSFARYVSRSVIDKILLSDKPTKLEGERKKVTILFSDIRQFTSLAEKLPPEKVVALLNEYFEFMLEAIFSHNGTLDKFIGDGLMAEFGAPVEDEFQEKNAILTALQMCKSLQTLNQKWKAEGKPPIDIGIGIHTGYAIVGNIGSEQRMEYTAIGDTVNVASRLQQATKSLKTPIIISKETHRAIKGEFPSTSLGHLSLPGRQEEVEAYSILPPL